MGPFSSPRLTVISCSVPEPEPVSSRSGVAAGVGFGVALGDAVGQADGVTRGVGDGFFPWWLLPPLAAMFSESEEFASPLLSLDAFAS